MCNKLFELYNLSDDDIFIVFIDVCVIYWGVIVIVLYGKKLEIIEKIKKLII